MRKFTLLFLLATTFTAKAFGGPITTDNLAIGDNVTYAFGGTATLNWITKERDQPADFGDLIVNQSNTEYPANHSKYFGSSQQDSGTTNVMDLYLEHSYSFFDSASEQSFYRAIAVTLLQPVSTFSFKAESFSGDHQLILFFDPNGNFINHQNLNYTSSLPHPDLGVVLDYNHSFDLRNQNIGAIVLGSWSSATYYYEFSIDVPEPSSALLVILGLAGIGSSRAIKRKMSQY